MAGGRPLDEFAMIARFFAPLAAGEAGARGLQDDAATLAVEPGRELVVTSDCLVAGVHFLADTAAADIAYRALAVNLSDLAAMGAHPQAYTVALSMPEDIRKSVDWIAAFARSLSESQDSFAVTLIGGDTVSTPGPLSLTVTALGTVATGTALRRGGARVGDRVFVSGSLGDAALGLRALQGRLPDLLPAQRDFLVARHLRPSPRLRLGQALVGLASAAADVSDGLLADIGHICAASGVAARLEAARVPVSEATAAAIAAEPALAGLPLSGGDDYELVFTLPETAVEAARARADAAGTPIHEIGDITAGSGVAAVNRSGAPLAVTETGFRHF